MKIHANRLFIARNRFALLQSAKRFRIQMSTVLFVFVINRSLINSSCVLKVKIEFKIENNKRHKKTDHVIL